MGASIFYGNFGTLSWGEYKGGIDKWQEQEDHRGLENLLMGYR